MSVTKEQLDEIIKRHERVFSVSAAEAYRQVEAASKTFSCEAAQHIADRAGEIGAAADESSRSPIPAWDQAVNEHVVETGYGCPSRRPARAVASCAYGAGGRVQSRHAAASKTRNWNGSKPSLRRSTAALSQRGNPRGSTSRHTPCWRKAGPFRPSSRNLASLILWSRKSATANFTTWRSSGTTRHLALGAGSAWRYAHGTAITAMPNERQTVRSASASWTQARS